MEKKLLLLVFFFASFHSYSQDTTEYRNDIKFKHNLETGLIIGGQVANKNFIYNSGAIIYYSSIISHH